MKKIIPFVLILCLCFNTFSMTLAEKAADETTAEELYQAGSDPAGAALTEKSPAEMTAEELYQAGDHAINEEDYDKALEYLQLAADQGDAKSISKIGMMYIQGDCGEPDPDKGIEYLQKASELGSPEANYNLGSMYANGMYVILDYGKAEEYLQKACDLGYAEAYKTLTVMNYYGLGMEADPGKALEIYQKTVDLGDASACYNLGYMYYSGFIAEQDYGKAAEYYQKAADLGSALALWDLGSMYYNGTGVKQDYGKAVSYFTQAAELGDSTAMFILSECCAEGKGVEKDPEKAEEWYRKALEAGYMPDEEEPKGTDYKVRTVDVVTELETIGSMDLRFYGSAPNVPYYGMKAYVNYMYQTGLTVTSPDGIIWEVANPNGTKIQVNPSAGTIEAADWARFQIPPLPYTGPVGIKDSGCAWTYYSEMEFDDPPAPVTFDFEKYGIPVYADEDDVYLPLGLLVTMFTDVACNHMMWNGHSVLKSSTDFNTFGIIPAEWFEEEPMGSLLTGKKQRPADVILEDYAELCFAMDYFGGHPGIASLDSGILEKGFDAALDDLPEGKKLRDGLMNPDLFEYMAALNELFCIGLNDGHCWYFGLIYIASPTFPYPEINEKRRFRMGPSLLIKGQNLDYVNEGIKTTRRAIWGNEVYRECGSTAILRIDSFHTDTAGWEAYYAGEGEIPMDAVGITWTGVKRASENPAIKNILFDVSANGGGSSDVMMYMIDLILGDNILNGYNTLTKQHQYTVMHSDKNLDGVFDEKDEEVKYDFNYAVLTTRGSFSCGNLFPIVMQEHGAVLLGEPSSGGSCSVLMGTFTEGGEYFMSGYLWALLDKNGEFVESGCKTDLPIERIELETSANADLQLSIGDYTPYFDDVMLDRMINEWFEEEALAPAA